MASAIKIIVITLVLHFISDFNLQIGAKLHEMKQKAWWKEQLGKNPSLDPRPYRCDWICALLIHSFVWSAITFAPILWVMESIVGIAICLLANTAVHAWIDHAKANEYALSLVEDQLLHIVQIGMTLWAWMALS
jgi:hypothetical protein